MLPTDGCLALQKKQVEIKEVNVKKTSSVVSSNTGELLHVQYSLTNRILCELLLYVYT